MRFEKHHLSLPVSNHDNVDGLQNQRRRHGELFPSSIRGIFCGPSNCGKTNALLSCIYEPNGLRFRNVYIFSRSLFQPKYAMLGEVLNGVEGMGYFPYSDNDDIIDPADALDSSLMIFDDVACDKQDKIRAYFSMGRHKNIDPFYLCQTYTRIPKHLIRDNANFLVLFKQDEMNLRHVYDEHVNSDMNFGKFKDMCRECWRDKFGFIVIDKDADIDNGRYRRGFDEHVLI